MANNKYAIKYSTTYIKQFNNILKYFQIYPVRRTKKLLKGCKNMI